MKTKVKGDTKAGQVLGTVTYMSPEQARGLTVDQRTDIFSLGIVLYEMLTGEAPFHGPSGAETMSAIINQPTPALARSVKGPMVPEVARIVGRCLEKDPEDRYQTAKDLLSELRRVKRDSESGARAPYAGSTRAPSRGFAWAGAAIAALAVATGFFLLSGDTRDATPRFINPVQVTSAVGVEDYPAWSPDGQTLAYESNQSGNWDIWITQVGSGQHLNRTKDQIAIDRWPSWSPDGREVAFSSRRDDGGVYVKSPLTGSPRRVASHFYTRDTQWSTDGNELHYTVGDFGDGEWWSEVLTLESGRSSIHPLPGSASTRHDARWSPDGRFVAYVDAPDTAHVTRLWLLRVSDGEAIPITDGKWADWSPDWSADGEFLYFISNRGGVMDLWRRAIGTDRSPVGNPELLTTGIGMRHARFSADGSRMAYSRGRTVSNLWRVPIPEGRLATWDDAEQLTFDQAQVESVDVSSDGIRLFIGSDRAGNQDIWSMPASGGDLEQVTTDPTPDWHARVSPDGNEIAFYAFRSGNRDIWVMPSDGGPARQLTDDPSPDHQPQWSPDGQTVAFWSVRGGNIDIYTIPATGGPETRLTNDPAFDVYPTFSPDRRWLAFVSARGDGGIWRMPSEGGEPEQLTRRADSGFFVWSRDGNAIYFEDGNNLWSVSAEGGEEHRLTELSGRRGVMGRECLATDGMYLYFSWQEDLGDIWVMDVVYEER